MEKLLEQARSAYGAVVALEVEVARKQRECAVHFQALRFNEAIAFWKGWLPAELTPYVEWSMWAGNTMALNFRVLDAGENIDLQFELTPDEGEDAVVEWNPTGDVESGGRTIVPYNGIAQHLLEVIGEELARIASSASHATR